MFSHKNIVVFNIVFCLAFVIPVMSSPCRVYSKETDDISGDGIIYAEGQKEAFRIIEGILDKHKECVTVSYPGIIRDFKRYKKNNYIDFFDELSFMNGYNVGTVSGVCIDFNDSDEESVTFQFSYLTTGKQEKYISRKVKKLVGKFKGQSTYNKIKGAHDYITSHTSYDSKYYNPYYVFRNGKGICMSYALAFQRILTEMRIPCIYIKGDNHAWNMVKIDGMWYGVDVTWDDSRGNYNYFLKGTKDFGGHENPDSKVLRRLKKARYSYRR